MRLVEPLPPDVRLLHIGLPKTGTTALQSTASARREELLDYGVRYPGTAVSHRDAVSAFMGRRWGWAGPGANVPERQHWERLMHEVETETSRRVWISYESAAESDDEQAERFVQALGDRTHIVVTLRPYGALLVSTYQQYLKTGVIRDFESWLRAVLADPPDQSVTPTFHRRSNQGQVVRRWAAAAGPERVTAVVVDKAVPTRLTDAFESLLDLPERFLVDDSLGGLQANRSLSAQESELVRRINMVVRHQGLEWAEYNALFRRGGVGRLMQARRPGRQEAALVLPQWAADRASELGRRYTEEIAASGIRVVGDLEVLAAPVAGVESLPPLPQEVEMEVAVEMAAGLLSAGTGRGPFFGERPSVSPVIRSVHEVPVRDLLGSLAHRARRRLGRQRS